jgi:hypothetical protein
MREIQEMPGTTKLIAKLFRSLQLVFGSRWIIVGDYFFRLWLFLRTPRSDLLGSSQKSKILVRAIKSACEQRFRAHPYKSHPPV